MLTLLLLILFGWGLLLEISKKLSICPRGETQPRTIAGTILAIVAVQMICFVILLYTDNLVIVQ